jgi:alpha-galactosidase
VALQPSVERDLPIVFNEWCTTWGDPRHERVVEIADRLAGTDVKYLVIDAGWYKKKGCEWFNSHGDWVPSAELFPDGLAATAAAIRRRGLIPGLWFEMETVGDTSAACSMEDHLLKRDGLPITVGNRRFWDMNDPAAIDYLARRVIGTLRDCGFGYPKEKSDPVGSLEISCTKHGRQFIGGIICRLLILRQLNPPDESIGSNLRKCTQGA